MVWIWTLEHALKDSSPSFSASKSKSAFAVGAANEGDGSGVAGLLLARGECRTLLFGLSICALFNQNESCPALSPPRV